MLGNCSGFSALLKKEIRDLQVIVYFCLLPRQALAFKALPPSQNDTLNSCGESLIHSGLCFE